MLGRLFRATVENTKTMTVRNIASRSANNKTIVNTKELRSELFASRKRIPGRKVKFLVVACFFGFTMNHAKIREIHGYFDLRDKEHQRLQRRSIPFFQAVEDLRFLALQDRQNLITEALFEKKGANWWNSIVQRYYLDDEGVMNNFVKKHCYQHGKKPRNIVPYTDSFRMRLTHGYEIPNI